MSKFYIFFINNKTIFLSILVFSLGIVATLYLFPKGRKFKFEYQQNKVWQHPDLFAPFSFSIDKTEEELRHERDSIIRTFSPYYVCNSQVESYSVDSFAPQFRLLLSEQGMYNETIERVFSEELLRLLAVGVIDEQKPYKTLIIECNNQKQRRTIEKVYTIIEAQTALVQAVAPYMDSVTLKKVKQLVYAHARANYVFDKDVSQEMKKNLLSKISAKYGYIGEGTRIISRGDIILEHHVKVLNSLKKEYEGSSLTTSAKFAIFVGQSLFIVVLFILLLLLLFHFDKEILSRFSHVMLIITSILLFVGLASATKQFNHLSIYTIPYIALPLILSSFFNARVAFYVHIITIIIVGYIAPNSFDFIVLQLFAGTVALFSSRDHFQRKSMFLSVLLSFVSYSVVFFALSLIKEGGIESIEWIKILWFALSSVLLFTAYMLMYIFERVFKITSSLTLYELNDTNNKLLRQLSEEAPGTFQHSIMVANLTEAALQKIGGNVLLGRVGALYHDIGKLYAPHYFIENQFFSENPHNELSAIESAQRIIEHIHYGRELARKHNLPKEIEEMIFGHHGNSKMWYFLDEYKKENPDIEHIDETPFTYPAPKPSTTELAVLMMADSVEAASRSIKIESKEQIETFVTDIVQTIVHERNFDNVHITLREIDDVTQIFVQKLITINHARIPYPKKNELK